MDQCCQLHILAIAEEWESYHREGSGRISYHEAAMFLKAEAGPIVPIHMCPIGDSSWVPCCGKNAHELLGHRMTLDGDLVTCKGVKNAN